MGLKLFSDSPHALPNPDPRNFTIVHWYSHGGWLVLTVRYPDATTFGGQKVLVYRGYVSPSDLLMQTRRLLDPHFVESGPSPAARFPATTEGHDLAQRFVHSVKA